MNQLTVEEFLAVVQESQLVEPGDLTQAISACQLNHSAPRSAETLAHYLVTKGLVTPWQQQNLLAGRSKGYFLAGYRILRHLGSGGMSSVFLAQHPLIDRQLAIKVLPRRRLREGTVLARFTREARAMARLSHPNIVRAYDIDQQGDNHFLVMEYVVGEDLRAIVRSRGPLPLEQAANCVAQVANGLQHAHDRGLIHRDVKPANLVWNEQGIVKILDLGLARLADEDELAALTANNADGLMGTADYLSPEQARNSHAIDHRADIYSLGCTFYYLLTGHAPFSGGTIAERILRHQSEPPRDVRAERDDCPHAIADLCMKMLAKKPADRIQAAGTVALRLLRWLDQNGFEPPTTTAATPVYLSQRPDRTEQAHAEQETKALGERRQPRGSTAVRPPLWLWLLLASCSLLCMTLLIVILLRQQQ